MFSGFFQMVPLLNDENKSCLNELKFWEGSQNPKWIKFWKCWLSIICGSQKSAKIHKTVGKVILSFYPMEFLSSFLYFLKTTQNKPKRVFCLQVQCRELDISKFWNYLINCLNFWVNFLDLLFWKNFWGRNFFGGIIWEKF